jgi:hypothetical protein
MTDDPEKFHRRVNDALVQPDAEAPPQEADPARPAAPAAPRWRPANEPTCCGSGCHDCPF